MNIKSFFLRLPKRPLHIAKLIKKGFRLYLPYLRLFPLHPQMTSHLKHLVEIEKKLCLLPDLQRLCV
jgi:hypothetical protein